MPLSTTQVCLRIALALLLPLYTRTTSVYEFSITFTAIIAIACTALQAGQTVDVYVAKQFTLALALSFIDNYVADYIVFGPWMALGMHYLILWEKLWYLLPDIAMEHKAHLRNLLLSGKFTACIDLPLILAGILTVALFNHGFVNTNHSPFRAILNGVIILTLLANLLQNLAVAFVRALGTMAKPVSYEEGVGDLVPRNFISESLRANDSIMPPWTTNKTANDRDSAGSSYTIQDITSRLREGTQEEVEKKVSAVGVLNKDSVSLEPDYTMLPKEQRRPSTRRRG